MFSSAEDYFDFEKLIEHCQSVADIDAQDRADACQLFRLLRSEFGATFLRETSAEGHPLFGLILNLAPWTRRALAQIFREIQATQGFAGFRPVLKRLADPRRADEALHLLGAASRFHHSGFDLAFEPRVLIGGRPKVPDLQLQVPEGERLYAEVTSSRPSDEETKSFKTMHHLWLHLSRRPSIQYAARLHRALARRHLEETLTRVDSVVAQAEQSARLATLVIEGVLEVACAQGSAVAELAQWADKRDLQISSIAGPPYTTDEGKRVSEKMKKKALQLPDTHPGVIIISSNRVLLQLEDPRLVVSRLEDTLFELDHVVACYVLGNVSGPPAGPRIRLGSHELGSRERFGYVTEYTLLLWNRFSTHRPAPPVRRRLSAFAEN